MKRFSILVLAGIYLELLAGCLTTHCVLGSPASPHRLTVLWAAAIMEHLMRKAFCLVLLIGGAALGASPVAMAVDPAGYGQAGGEFDIRVPRVPADQLAEARALKPPFQPTPEILAEGKAIFLGRGTCFQCHGPEGKGNGGAAKVLPIQPRDFTNPSFAKLRTPGEMMWVLKNGSMGQSGKVPGTGMLPIVGQFLSEEDGWKALLYERSLGGSP